MKYLKIMLFAIIALFMIGNIEVSAATNPQVTLVSVELTSYFDESNQVTTTINSLTYGSSVSFSSSLSESEGYTFAFWQINGVIRYDLAIDESIIITGNQEIVAVFKPVGKVVAAFMDSNGKMLDVQYLIAGGNAEDLTLLSLPTKPGYAIASVKWNHSLLDIQVDTIFVLQYELIEEGSFTISVTNGSGDGVYIYNTVATIIADAPAEGEYFSYWMSGTKILGVESTLSFTVLENITVEAVYSTSASTDVPFLSLSNDLGLRIGYQSYMAKAYLPSGFTLVEHGVIVSETTGVIDLNSVGTTKYLSNTFNNSTFEYLMSFSNSSIQSVRAYMIVKDGNGNYMTVYNEVVSEASPTVFADDLFFSFYMEGSSNNKVLSIFNGTGETVNLTGYSVKLYSNGSSTVGTTLNLTGELGNGEVYVIANGSANTTILAIADITSGVTNYNGDDAITLEHNGTVIDSIGQVGFDPGSVWGTGDITTGEHSLERLSSTTSGDSNPSDAYDPSIYWISHPQDDITNIDTFTMDGSGSGKSATSFDAYIDTLSYEMDGLLTLTNSYLRVYYDDGSSSIEIITEAMISNYSSSSPGNFQLTVTYGSMTDVLNYQITGTIVDETAPVITISGSADFNLLVDETWNSATALSWCSAMDNVDGSISCSLEDSLVNTSVAGNYTITYSAIDSSDNLATHQETVVVSITTYLEDLDYSGFSDYYATIDSSTNVIVDMAGLLRSTIQYVSYGDARYVYTIYSNGSQVILYDTAVTDSYQNVPATGLDGWGDGGVITTSEFTITINREHVWACSDMRIMPVNSDRTLDGYVGFELNDGSFEYRPDNTDRGHYSDLFNLWNALATPNMIHSDHFFGEENGDSASSYLMNDIFYPGEEYKGDVARILFYMTLMYPYLTLVEEGSPFAIEGTIYYGYLDILMQWNLEDPVSDYEIAKCQTIFGEQGNRNPFVDFYSQGFAELLFESGDPDIQD